MSRPHQNPLRLKTLLLAGCCGLLLAGCSTKITYNFLDWWMTWHINRYISLEAEQRQVLTQEIKHFHAWHRSNELPRYGQLLAQLKQHLQHREMNADRLGTFADEAVSLWQASLAQLVSPTAELLGSLSDRQVKELLQNLAQQHQQYRKEYVDLSPEDLQQQRQERMEDILEDWIGRLNRSQRAQIAAWAGNLRNNGEWGLRERQRWSQRLEALLLQRHTADLHQPLQRLFLRSERDWSSTYRDNLFANRHATLQLITQLNNTLSDEQVRQRNRRLQRYIDDFNALSASDGAAATTAAIGQPSAFQISAWP